MGKRLRRTSLRNGTVQIETIEHCMSALAGMGIDNVYVQLNAGEVPAMDGSSLPFVEKLKDAGIVALDQPRHVFRVPETVRVAEGHSYVMATPPSDEDEALEIIYDLDYGPKGHIGEQVFKIRLTPETFEQQIAAARTFVLKEEADQFRAAGLGTHLTYQDILVFGEDGPIENTLRFPDECVRHKILDLIGDLHLSGRFLVGQVFARQSGHSLNHELVRRLCEAELAIEMRSRMVSEPVLDIRKIQRILPHRFPFLMVDRVIKMEPGHHAIGIKNVTINEEFFSGHYPGQPIMPGVLIIEAMAAARRVAVRARIGAHREGGGAAEPGPGEVPPAGHARGPVDHRGQRPAGEIADRARILHGPCGRRSRGRGGCEVHDGGCGSALADIELT